MLKRASTGLVAACLAAIPMSPALADCQTYWTAAYRCMMGCGGCPANNGNRGRQTQQAGPSLEEIARRQRVAASRQYNDQGYAAYARGDWAEAVRLFQLSLDNDPGDPVVSHNLDQARSRLQDQKDSAAASSHIAAMMQNYANSSSPAAATGGLDFDQGAPVPRPGVNAEARGSQSLDFGDPMVVDARNPPSGLPGPVDDAITSGYAGAPPGVSDRVRKGFQAIASHDWRAAQAWFKDALNHDPQNAGLKRLTELADFTLTRTRQVTNTSSAPGRLQLPENSDMQFLFSAPKQQRPPTSPAVLQLPKESDLVFLFPGLPALQARDLSEYTEKYWISRIGAEPRPVHSGRGIAGKPSVSSVAK